MSTMALCDLQNISGFWSSPRAPQLTAPPSFASSISFPSSSFQPFPSSLNQPFFHRAGAFIPGRPVQPVWWSSFCLLDLFQLFLKVGISYEGASHVIWTEGSSSLLWVGRYIPEEDVDYNDGEPGDCLHPGHPAHPHHRHLPPSDAALSKDQVVKSSFDIILLFFGSPPDCNWWAPMEGWDPKLLQKRSPIGSNIPNVKEKHRCGPRWPTSSPSLSTTATSASFQDPPSLERSSAFYYFTQFRFVIDISYHCYKFICSICSCKCVHNFRHSILCAQIERLF